MESEDRRRHQVVELVARTMPRVWPIPVALFRHHLILTLAIPLAAAAGSTGSSDLGPVGSVAAQHGHCHSDAGPGLRLGYADRMTSLSYRGHRFPAAIIQHAIWLYLRFTLSYRDVEELLAERGLDLSYETIRRWVLKFGPVVA